LCHSGSGSSEIGHLIGRSGLGWGIGFLRANIGNG